MAQVGYTPISLYYSATPSATPSAGNLANGELALNVSDGKLYYKDNGGVVQVLATKAGASGDVVGPASSTDNALVRFDGTTGKLVQNSTAILSDAGVLSGLTDISASGAVTLSGGTANGVAYLNGSKVLTTGSALTFDGTSVELGYSVANTAITVYNGDAVNRQRINLTMDGVNGVINVQRAAGTIPSLIFKQDSSEQMRLTSTGLGIGTSSPVGKVHARYVGSGSNLVGRFEVDNGIGSNNFLDILADSTNYYVTLKSTGAANGGFKFANASTTYATIDNAGNLGLGVTPQTQSTGKALEVGRAGNGIASWFNNNNIVANMYYDSADKFAGTGYALQYYQDASSGAHVWRGSSASGSAGGTASMSESMRLDSSGNLLVGTTSGSFSQIVGGGGYALGVNQKSANCNVLLVDGVYTSGTQNLVVFSTSGTARGLITFNGTSVAYTTLSDYRLKEQVQPMTGALAKVAALKPVTYKWKADGSDGEGFIAHELAEIVPDAVSGEKDAVNEDGSIKPQGIDTSFLVATLTAAIQEQQAIIEQLKADVAALKGAA